MSDARRLKELQSENARLKKVPPGKPNQNAYIELFNGRFGDKYLNEYWFTSFPYARVVFSPGGGNAMNRDRRTDLVG